MNDETKLQLKLQSLDILIDRLASDITYDKSQFIEDSREVLAWDMSTELYEYLVNNGVEL